MPAREKGVRNWKALISVAEKVRCRSLEWRLGETEKGNTVNGVYAERHGLEFQSPKAFQVRGEGMPGRIHAVGGCDGSDSAGKFEQTCYDNNRQ